MGRGEPCFAQPRRPAPDPRASLETTTAPTPTPPAETSREQPLRKQASKRPETCANCGLALRSEKTQQSPDGTRHESCLKPSWLPGAEQTPLVGNIGYDPGTDTVRVSRHDLYRALLILRDGIEGFEHQPWHHEADYDCSFERLADVVEDATALAYARNHHHPGLPDRRLRCQAECSAYVFHKRPEPRWCLNSVHGWMDGSSSQVTHASYSESAGWYSTICGKKYVSADLTPVSRGGSGGRHRPFALELVTCRVCLRELTHPWEGEPHPFSHALVKDAGEPLLGSFTRTETPPPTRDELVEAWGDHVLNQLRPRVRALFAVGRFLGGGSILINEPEPDETTVIMELPNLPHVERAQELVGEVSKALSAYFEQKIELALVPAQAT